MLGACSDNKILNQNSLIHDIKKLKIMPLGDSITQGIHLNSKNIGYRRDLYNLLTYNNFEFDFVGSMKDGSISDFDKDHEGHGGWHANQIQDSIYNWLIKNPADIILLHIGTNDLNKQQLTLIIIQEIEQILCQVDKYEQKYNVPVKVILAKLINHLLYIEETNELNDYITQLDINMTNDQKNVQETFLALRDKLVDTFQSIDGEKFTFKNWKHSGSGGGVMGKIRGPVIEKGGVNISTVSGIFSEKMKSRIPGTKESAHYWATGISVVLHPKSPLIPSMHFNLRYLNTQKKWFGGGLDVTPSNEFKHEAISFHQKLKEHCDNHNFNYYKEHKKWCDEYFFLKHRNESRGIGGIFFDYLNTDNHKKDFNYVKETGDFFHNYSEYILKKYKNHKWTEAHRKKQLIKRSRYVEFNLLYDRGTKFGLETGGNIEAILMSMPPLAAWE